MPLLTINLCEGFYQTQAIVYIDNVEIYRAKSVTTRMQVGLADIIKLVVAKGINDLEIKFPDINRSISSKVDLTTDTHLRIDLDNDGNVSLLTQKEPFNFI